MVTYVKGDIFSSPARILVNTVNTEGVMGKGIALEFKKRYPDMFKCYRELCLGDKFHIGSLMIWRKDYKWILLFPTKESWRQPSKMDYIEAGLKKFATEWDKLGAESIAFPRLGCGNGGLNWDDVRPLMEKYLDKIPMQIYVYVDNYVDPIPEHQDVTEMEKWMSGEAELDGYKKFSFKLSKYLEKSMLVLPNNHICEMGNDGAMIRIDDIDVEDDDVCYLWNFVRDAGILDENEIPSEYKGIANGFMEILRLLGYVSRVFVTNENGAFSVRPNGYQYIAD